MITPATTESLRPFSAGSFARGLPAAARRSRPFRCVLYFWACLLPLLGALWAIGVFGGNIRVVMPGAMYRSAQLTGSTLKRALIEDHIKTVINLRGKEATDLWYQDETSVCRNLGISHIDVAFSATHLPPPEEMRKLLKAFDTARYPIMVHCMGGSDRSGLASTLYMALYQHEPLDEAQVRWLSLRYGHIKWGPARAMDHFLALYRSTGHGEDLRKWILEDYPAVYKRNK